MTKCSYLLDYIQMLIFFYMIEVQEYYFEVNYSIYVLSNPRNLLITTSYELGHMSMG